MAEDFFLSNHQMEVPPLTSEDNLSFTQRPNPHTSTVNNFEGHQQSQFDQYLATCAAPISNTASGSGQFLPPSSSLPPHMGWSGRQDTVYQLSPNEQYYHLPSIKNEESFQDQFGGVADGHLPYMGFWPYGHSPKSAQSFHIDNSMTFEFQTFPSREACFNDMQRAQTVSYAFQKGAAELAENISQSPTAESNCFASSRSASEYPSEVTECPVSITLAKPKKDNMKGSALAAERRTSEEPYAKLIYRALLSTPNHSMVLQEIYQWFLENTNKGKSMSTGWRNSIRHNLSMNAAFCKTNRASNGDDSKKASVWVLDPFAVKNGVTPTTRYRKTGKKAMKSNNTTIGGVKPGGRGCPSTAKTKCLRRESREVNGETRKRSGRERFTNQQPSSAAVNCHRMSPSTPNDHESPDINQYYSSKDLSLEGFVSPEDMHGLKIDDNLVNYGDGYGVYPERHPYTWSGFHF